MIHCCNFNLQPLSESIDMYNGSVVSSTSPAPCVFSEDSETDENCSTDIYNSIPNWKSSKTYINEQIRRLRAQLFELKVMNLFTRDYHY